MLTWIKGLFVAPNHSSPNARVTFSDPPMVEHEHQESQVISLRIKLPQRNTAAIETPDNVPASTPAKVPTSTPKVKRSATLLRNFNFASQRQLQRLSRTGIKTAADLKNVDIKQLVAEGHLSDSAGRWLRRRRRIVLLFLSIRSLRPIDALILHTVHRRRLNAVASDQPIRLQRDVQRFLLTSSGQKLLGSKQPPTMAVIEKWVEEARLKIGHDAKP